MLVSSTGGRCVRRCGGTTGRSSAPGWVSKRQQNYTWAQDAAGNRYVSAVTTTLDPGTPSPQQTKTTQVVDSHGNVTQTAIYDYGNLTTPARTYTNSYLADGNYTSRNIWNRLVSSTVSNGSQTATLVTNTYDGTALANIPNPLGVGGPVTSVPQHDDANYGMALRYRGNLTRTVKLGLVLLFTNTVTYYSGLIR